MDNEIIDTGLVKNIRGIIINYLTDPPILPYIDELRLKTELISRDNDWCYVNYYIFKYRDHDPDYYSYTNRRYFKSKIKKSNNHWYILGGD